jgi:hypothetical protein
MTGRAKVFVVLRLERESFWSAVFGVLRLERESFRSAVFGSGVGVRCHRMAACWTQYTDYLTGIAPMMITWHIRM